MLSFTYAFLPDSDYRYKTYYLYELCHSTFSNSIMICRYTILLHYVIKIYSCNWFELCSPIWKWRKQHEIDVGSWNSWENSMFSNLLLHNRAFLYSGSLPFPTPTGLANQCCKFQWNWESESFFFLVVTTWYGRFVLFLLFFSHLLIWSCHEIKSSQHFNQMELIYWEGNETLV